MRLASLSPTWNISIIILENVQCSGQEFDKLVLLIPRKYLNKIESIKLIVTLQATEQRPRMCNLLNKEPGCVLCIQAEQEMWKLS